MSLLCNILSQMHLHLWLWLSNLVNFKSRKLFLECNWYHFIISLLWAKYPQGSVHHNSLNPLYSFCCRLKSETSLLKNLTLLLKPTYCQIGPTLYKPLSLFHGHNFYCASFVSIFQSQVSALIDMHHHPHPQAIPLPYMEIWLSPHLLF